jgi:hypothetical protein
LAQEEGFDTGRFKARPPVPEWSDFDDCNWVFLYKRSEYFIGTDDETFSAAMRVHNPDRSSPRNPRLIRSPKSTWLAEIVSDGLQLLHRTRVLVIARSASACSTQKITQTLRRRVECYFF